MQPTLILQAASEDLYAKTILQDELGISMLLHLPFIMQYQPYLEAFFKTQLCSSQILTHLLIQ